MMKEPFLTGDQVEKMVLAKLKEYKKFNLDESYAMFMGKSQILEFGLKGLLFRKYGVPLEKSEKWPMGKTKNKLKKEGLRPDFISLLEKLIDYRNYMAHEFLLNTAMTKSLANFSGRKLYGDLFRAIFELEQIIILYDWCEENEGW